MLYRLHFCPTGVLLCEDRYKEKSGPFAVGFSCCLQMELMPERWFQLNITATSCQHLSGKVQASQQTLTVLPQWRIWPYILIEKKKKIELPYPNQSCPARWCCQQWRKFMLVLIMALKSSLMKNYRWVCFFWACFTHCTWVTSANFHLITDVLSQNTEYLGLKTRPCKLKFTWNIFFGRAHRSAYKERKYLCFLLQSYQILKRELSPLVRSR